MYSKEFYLAYCQWAKTATDTVENSKKLMLQRQQHKMPSLISIFAIWQYANEIIRLEKKCA